MKTTNYICVIGDVVGSRDLPASQREELQTRLGACLDQLNRKKAGLVSPYTITLGDEFQVVLDDADRLFSDFWLVQYAIFPVKVRFSIGTGTLNTRINTQQALGMDGPAFYSARSGIEELRKKGGLFKWTSYPDVSDAWVNPALDLISHDSSSWKQKRLLVLHELLDGKKNVEEMAKRIGLSRIAIYKNIQAGALKTVVVLSNEICKLINIAIENDHGAPVSLPDKHSPDNKDISLL